jgi:hypothetical protein
MSVASGQISNTVGSLNVGGSLNVQSGLVIGQGAFIQSGGLSIAAGNLGVQDNSVFNGLATFNGGQPALTPALTVNGLMNGVSASFSELMIAGHSQVGTAAFPVPTNLVRRYPQGAARKGTVFATDTTPDTPGRVYLILTFEAPLEALNNPPYSVPVILITPLTGSTAPITVDAISMPDPNNIWYVQIGLPSGSFGGEMWFDWVLIL